MTPVNCSRLLKVVHLARFWPCQRSVTAFPQHPVLPPSCQHRCASRQQKRSKTTSKRTTEERGDDSEDAPIPYLSSKALDWSVHNSYGRHKKRPWFKVAPLSIGFAVFMAWVFLREETEIDRQLEVHLHERLPNLFEDPSKKGTRRDSTEPDREEDEKLKD